MTRFTRILPSAVVAAALCGCSDPQGVSTPGSPETFSDELISFPIPEGGSVTRAAEDSYLVFFGAEMYVLKLRGAAEPEDFGRQRAEASRTETDGLQGKPVDDGESVVTVGEISEVSRHEIDGDPVYIFIHSATAESETEGGTGYNTIGFGSVDGNAIWFQHTSANEADHPASVLSFLETVTFRQGERDGAGQPETQPQRK